MPEQTPMDTQQLWQAVLGELELDLSKANFMTWFKSTFICTYANDAVVIGVPNTFTKAWFEKKYHSLILKALQKVTENQVRDISYRVETQKINIIEPAKDETVTSFQEPVSADSGDGQTYNESGLNFRYTFSNFVVGKGNELAQAACMAVAKKPGGVYNPLFIYGGVGLGKTHLLQAVGNKILEQGIKKKILYVSCEKFTNDFIKAISTNNTTRFKNIYRSVDALLIDDIQFLAGKEGTQEEFFHTFNALHQNNKQIIMSSDRPPKAIPALESRLVSRFEWGMLADVSTPDLETRIAILKSKCQEKNFILPDEIINYIATNVQNNVRELEGALNRLLAHAQLKNTELAIEAVKKILGSISSQQKRTLTPKKIIAIVSDYYDVSIEDILGACRKKSFAVPRQITMYLMREEAKISYPSIGQEIGNRDHTTAMHAYVKISKILEIDEKLQHDINFLRQRLYN